MHYILRYYRLKVLFLFYKWFLLCIIPSDPIAVSSFLLLHLKGQHISLYRNERTPKFYLLKIVGFASYELVPAVMEQVYNLYTFKLYT